MTKKFGLIMTLVFMLVFAAACGNTNDPINEDKTPVDIGSGEVNNDDKDTTNEPNQEEPINEDDQVTPPKWTVTSIKSYDNIFLTDWMDDHHVIAIKANEDLEKMKLEELADQYPMSIYQLNTQTDEMTLVLAKDNTNLGSGKLSPDKKYMIVTEMSLGDPAFTILNLETGEQTSLSGDPIAGAMSAEWGPDGNVYGTAYAGGIFVSDPSGISMMVDNINNEMPILVESTGNVIYYNTQSNEALMAYDIKNETTKTYTIKGVSGLKVSPDGSKLLILQMLEDSQKLIVMDLATESKITIAEGTMIEGIAWSNNGSVIAYQLTHKEEEPEDGLYIYDIANSNGLKISQPLAYPTIQFSQDNHLLLMTEYNGNNRNSYIVTLSE